ncbi:MAG: fimb protein [Neisseriaceae bacterium]|nr:fimb protein [Neisseriaceae bacterium]
MSPNFSQRFKFAAKLSSIHLLISLIVATLMAALVFLVWYKYPYTHILGGLELFFLVCSVDVVCGPLMTLILSNPKKSKREMILDFSVVGAIQIAALLYGMHTVYVARPVYYAFDADRFTTVTAAELAELATPDDMAKAPKELQSLPKLGAKPIALYWDEKNADPEKIRIPMIARPEHWRVYNKTAETAKVREKMLPVEKLYTFAPNKNKKAIIDKAVAKTGISADKLYFLPFTCDRNLDWSALLNEQGEIVGYVDADGFGQ